MGYHLRTPDPETGCTSETPYPRLAGYEAGFRFFHPGIGRWVNRDPIGILGGLALYGLGQNSTPNNIDVLGLRVEASCPLHDYLTKYLTAYLAAR